MEFFFCNSSNNDNGNGNDDAAVTTTPIVTPSPGNTKVVKLKDSDTTTVQSVKYKRTPHGYY